MTKQSRRAELTPAPTELGRDGPHAADLIDVAVGQRIKIRRLALGMSQAALADYLNITFQQVQKYERGSNRISASKLVKTAECLKTTVGELVGEGSAPQPRLDSIHQLSTPGAAELLEIFASIRNPNLRAAVLSLMRLL